MIGPRVKLGMVMFDRSIIRSNWSNMARTPITRAGMLVRKISRNSIRRGKKGGKPSAPGSPPKSRVAGANPPFKQIFSVPNRTGTSATVGMIGYGKSVTPAPGLHEHGGQVVRRVPIRQKPTRDARGRFVKGRTLYKRKLLHLAKRPFMAPALTKAGPMLPALFRGAFNRSARGRV